MSPKPAQATTSRQAPDAAAVLVALGFPTLVTWAYFILLAEQAPQLQQAAYGVGKTLQFAFPLVWVLAVRRERLRLTWPSTRGLAAGAAFGAAAFAATVAGYYLWFKPIGLFDVAGDAIHQKVTAFGADSFWPYVALGTFYSACHSLLEEYYWRWFVFGRLRQLAPLWAAIVVSSLGFMAHHVLVLGFYFGWTSPATIFFSLAVAVGGAFWAWLYQRSGSLYAVWLSHLLIDAAIFAVGYDLLRTWMGG